MLQHLFLGKLVNFIADKCVIHTAIVTLLQHVILNVLYLYIYMCFIG
jgi:hypothetical protein